MHTVNNTFITNFKIGDNIHHNLEVLKSLYASEELLPEKRKKYLEKPITVILVCICEAIIFDFIERSKILTREGIIGLPEASLIELRQSNTWNFEKKINLFNRLNILQTNNEHVYEYLEKLSWLRNRMHIQNEKNRFEADEIKAFKKSRRVEAEKMLELLMKKISKLYPRPKQMHGYVKDFELPWADYFDQFGEPN
jgi:hypothetical protein